jgi:Asp-tRNA(Asn)/Glu-tRNA(Gln) amidotransferase A subunit family amidase
VEQTKVFGFFDFPAVVLPVGQVSQELESDTVKEMSRYELGNALDHWNWKTLDLNTMDSVPMGVLVMARRSQEEKALGTATVINSLLGEQA